MSMWRRLHFDREKVISFLLISEHFHSFAVVSVVSESWFLYFILISSLRFLLTFNFYASVDIAKLNTCCSHFSRTFFIFETQWMKFIQTFFSIPFLLYFFPFGSLCLLNISFWFVYKAILRFGWLKHASKSCWSRTKRKGEKQKSSQRINQTSSRRAFRFRWEFLLRHCDVAHSSRDCWIHFHSRNFIQMHSLRSIFLVLRGRSNASMNLARYNFMENLSRNLWLTIFFVP